MQAQLAALEIEWQHVAAHDSEYVDIDRLRQEVAGDRHIRSMGLGSQCCALTNFDLYRHIVHEDLPAALILQDDVELSADIKPFLNSLDWLPEDIGIVQFEKYGRLHSTRLLGPAIGTPPVDGRDLRLLHSRTGGAACYLVTRKTATYILQNKPLLRTPIDHLLFSPNLSPLFNGLGVAVITPALARQRVDGFASDLRTERQQNRKRITERVVRFGQEINRAPSQIMGWLRGARWYEFGYKK